MTCTETRIKIRTLATSTTDPDKASEMMLEAAKNKIKLTKRVLAVNLLKGLRRRRIGTHTLEKAAKLVTEEDERDEKVVIKI